MLIFEKKAKVFDNFDGIYAEIGCSRERLVELQENAPTRVSRGGGKLEKWLN